MYSSYLLQCLILEVFLVFIYKFFFFETQVSIHTFPSSVTEGQEVMRLQY